MYLTKVDIARRTALKANQYKAGMTRLLYSRKQLEHRVPLTESVMQKP